MKSNICNFIYNVCAYGVTIISSATILLLCILNIRYSTLMELKASEIPEIMYTSPLVIVVAILLGLIVVFGAPNILKHVTEKQLFQLFCIMYLFVGFYMIFNIDTKIRADAYDVNLIAREFSTGDYSQLDIGGYAFRFPYQLGLVSFFRLLMLYSKNTSFLYFTYLLLVIFINYAIWKISELYFENTVLITKLVIIGAFLFLPQLFFIFFLYGTIPGLTCVLFSVLFISRYFKYNKYSQCLVGILFMTLACILRNNYLIAGIAICILLFINWLKNRNCKNVIAIVVMLFSLLFCNKWVVNYYEYESGMTINSGTPMSTYIAMGLQRNIDNPIKGGWYNAYVWWMYEEVGYNNEIANEKAIESIRRSIREFVEDPSYMAEFFGNKIKTTWCEPTFQSVWSGPLEEYEQLTYTHLLQSIYQGRKGYRILYYCEKVYLIMILVFAFLGVVLGRKLKEAFCLYDMFAETYLVGGFLFHLFWEIKSQYVYPYIFLLIPLAAKGVYYSFCICRCNWTFGDGEKRFF